MVSVVPLAAQAPGRVYALKLSIITRTTVVVKGRTARAC
jgi:hypothetical protein